MGLIGAALRKTRKAIRRPDLVRNRILGELNFWPVSRLKSDEIRAIPTFCISMVSSQRRRRLMLRQAKSLGLARFEFIDAFEASSLDPGLLERDGLIDPAETELHHGSRLYDVEIACSLSHAEAYDRVVDEQLPYAIIVEDDALFVSRQLDALRLKDLPTDLEVLFLNAFLDREPPGGHIGGSIYTDSSYAGSGAAYLVTLTAAAKLAAVARPVIHASDGLLGRSLSWQGTQPHEFRQQGARTQLEGYIVYPFAALNGSDCRFTATSLVRE